MFRVPALVVALGFVVACSSSAKQPAVGNAAGSATNAVAIALVISGNEVWVGNEEHETDPVAQYPGALNGLRDALAKHPPGAVFAAGSQGTVVMYGTGAQVRVPIGPLAAVTPDALGTEVDYRGKLGSDLVTGVELGLAELAKSTAPRHVLIVIGDGNDTNNQAATVRLAALQKDSKAEIYALVYKSALSAETSVLPSLTPNVQTINTSDTFEPVLAALWTHVAAK